MSQADWTLMLYMAGDNGILLADPLDAFGYLDVQELKDGLRRLSPDARDRVHVVVQFDTREQGTHRYHLSPAADLASDRVQTLDETNTGDPATLRDFIVWAVQTYPARHYALVLWNHGNGWDDTDVYARFRARLDEAAREEPAMRAVFNVPAFRRALFTSTLEHLSTAAATPSQRGVLYDDSSLDFLDNRELQQALQQALADAGLPAIDLLGFDACLMAMLEVQYQVREQARLVVASQALEPAYGWPYNRLVQALPGATPEQVARALVRDYVETYNLGVYSRFQHEITQSAVATARLPALVNAWNALAQALLASLHEAPVFRAVLNARQQAHRFYNRPDYVDVGTFAAALAQQPHLPPGARSVLAQIRNLLHPQGNLVLANQALVRRGGNAPEPLAVSGVSVYFPERGVDDVALRDLYGALDFSREALWDEFLEHFAAVRRAFDLGVQPPTWRADRGLTFTPTEPTETGHATDATPSADTEQPPVEPATPAQPLKLVVAHGSITDAPATALVVNHVQGAAVGGAAGYVDDRLGGVISALVQQGSLTGARATVFPVPTLGRLPADVVLVAGLGTLEEFAVSEQERLQIVQAVGRVVAQTAILLGVEEVASIVHGAGGGGLPVGIAAREFVRGVLDTLATFGASASIKTLYIVEYDAEKYQTLQQALTYGWGDTPVPMVVETRETLSAKDAQSAARKRWITRLYGSEGAPQPTTTSRPAWKQAYLSILRHPDGTSLEFSYTGPEPLASEPRYTLPFDPSQVERFLQTIENAVRILPHSPGDVHETTLKRLRTIRDQLIPSELRGALDALPDDTVLTLRLDAFTAQIPWELFPRGETPLLLHSVVTRRLVTERVAGAILPPPSAGKVRVLIVANPTGDLPAAQAEGQRLYELLSAHPRLDVRLWEGTQAIDLLGEMGGYHVLHFAGHAAFNAERPELSALFLDAEGQERITAQNILQLPTRPAVVFLNACESGQAETLTWREAHRMAAGLAAAFIATGSRNVVATAWRVSDTDAEEMARAFYTHVLQGDALGQALHKARRAVFEQRRWTDVTWGSYLFYGDAAFRL
ncbi:hypothetical protein ARMA_1980 [Ardenticatena maritima]|uniref:CHAT domain-containing protein n=1 Tax=Ardenticatena maritima TaxID=872965 RepID=A0A0M9UD48_9CHLR|nr:clostripain-related cysteine peptidase [Ardenticatena maritima]KPL86553.1 hypothetical protein SE16_14920 [Ardenticatena maritima]GAP63557.1 hypothetical protein ARMA_1980 [Ardenticatena maritima]